MNDEQMQPLLEVWLRDRDEAPRDATSGIARVMGKVPQVRQRGRWWPLPAFDRPASTSPRRELAPVPIPTTNGRQPARGFTMFSAVKFVVAGVIVALFGGFLLAGVLTTQQADEMAPAAVTESPSPMTTEDLLSGMVTEEVEPGVLRVLNDGVRDLSLGSGLAAYVSIVAGHDGSVWVWSGDEVFRLGDETTYPWGMDDGALFLANPVDTVFGGDGTVWHRRDRDPLGLYHFDGETWTVERPGTRFDAVAMGSDGRLWAMWQGEHVGRRVDGEWETVTDAPDGYDYTTLEEHEILVGGDMAVTDDGTIWLWPVNTWFGGATERTNVHHFDGQTWQSLDLPGGDVGHAAVGQDGTVWWAASSEEDERVTAIHRFDGDEWQRFDAADDWPSAIHSGSKRLEVAPDGRLWVFSVAAYLFDGDVWTRYLDDVDIPPAPSWELDGYMVGHAGDVAPDGSAWVLATDTRSGPDPGVDLYVITPKAVAAAE